MLPGWLPASSATVVMNTATDTLYRDCHVGVRYASESCVTLRRQGRNLGPPNIATIDRRR